MPSCNDEVSFSDPGRAGHLALRTNEGLHFFEDLIKLAVVRGELVELVCNLGRVLLPRREVPFVLVKVVFLEDDEGVVHEVYEL